MHRTLSITALLAALLSSALWSQRPARLSWGALNVLVASDTMRGTLVWAAARPQDTIAPKRPREFIAYFNPDQADAWIHSTRAYLATRLSASDTGQFRASPVLVGTSGQRIFLLRRRSEGKWTDERFISLQESPDGSPVVVSATDQLARQFLESLDAINRRTYVVPDAPRDTIPIAEPGNMPVPDPRNERPLYPSSEGRVGVDGEVWVSFVITAEGLPDLSTLDIMLSDSPAFTANVRAAIAHHRYRPARRNGQSIAVRVFQQFSFILTRP